MIFRLIYRNYIFEIYPFYILLSLFYFKYAETMGILDMPTQLNIHGCCPRHFLYLDRTSIQTGLNKNNISSLRMFREQPGCKNICIQIAKQKRNQFLNSRTVASFSDMIPSHLCWHKQPKENPGLSFIKIKKKTQGEKEAISSKILKIEFDMFQPRLYSYI